MRFRVPGDGDAKLRELAADQADQFVRIPQSALHRPKHGVAARRIAAQGDDVFDIRRTRRLEVFAELFDRAADTREMRRDRKSKLAVHAGDDFQRRALRGAARTVRAGDEARPKLDQPRDVLEEIRDALRGLRRK